MQVKRFPQTKRFRVIVGDACFYATAKQIRSGSKHVFGVMIESHLQAGAQKFNPGQDPIDRLTYGQSITDACLGWDDSVKALEVLSKAVKARRG